MAGEGREATAEVQAYLDKHKISSVFEDLMSKIVKELPADPLEFLIAKLQALQRQKKRGISPRPSTTSSAAARSRSKMQVTGTAVTPKSSAASKEHLSKSTGGVRPTRPRTELTSTSTPSISKTTPTKVTPTRPITATKSVSTARGKATPTRSIPVPKRPTTAPSPGATKPTHSRLPPPPSASKTRIPSAAKMSPPKKATSQEATKLKQTPTKRVPTSKSAPATQSPAAAARAKPAKREERSAEEIDEFFGGARKSSPNQLRVGSEDEDDSDIGRQSDSDGDSSEGVRVGRGDGGGDSRHEEMPGLNLEELISKHRMACKHGRKAQRHKDLQSLLISTSPETTPPSLGYYSDSDDDSGEESGGVEVVEDYAALEDEGVRGVTRGKYTVREVPPSSEAAKVDLKVLICARCAKVLAGGADQGSEVTRSELTGSSPRASEFESASQIGSHTSFPQWEAGSAVGSEMSSALASSRSHDSASDVTLQSHDTWGGLAPQPRPHDVTASDVESEVQLPSPPPMEGRPWIQDPPPQHDTYGWAQQEGEK